MRKTILTILFFLICAPVWGATYYVRPNGGSLSQCNGTANVDFDGVLEGGTENCAFRSPATALQPGNVVMTGDDTMILADGSYQIHYGGVDIPTSGGQCGSSSRQFCLMASLPDGAKMYGENHASCDDLAHDEKPELWGGSSQHNAFRANSNTELKCLTFTDHDQCAFSGAYAGAEASQCDNDCGDGACTGTRRLVTLDGQENVLLENVDIIGGGHFGLNVYRSGSTTLRNVDIIGNAYAGINSDDGTAADDSLSGDWILDNVRIMWSGCSLRYPLVNTADITSEDNLFWCNSKGNCGGFGDGIGLGDGSIGNSWTITDSNISYNVSDGIDLLHGQGPVTVRRTIAQGNAGNPFKANPGSLIENSILIANCDFFRGKSYSMTGNCTQAGPCPGCGFEHCRASGNAIEFKASDSQVGLKVYGSTVIGWGDVLMNNSGTCSSGGQPTDLKNNIFGTGLEQTFAGNWAFDTTSFYYCSVAPSASNPSGNCQCNNHPISLANSVVHGFKGGTVPNGTDIKSDDPGFTGGPIPDDYESLDFDATLSAGSIARELGDESVGVSDALDYNAWPRGASWDAGAYEFDTEGGQTAPCDLDCEDCSYSQCPNSALTCYQWDSAAPVCRATQETCADDINDCTNQTDCENQGYYWYNSTCNVNPEGCDSLCGNCTDQTTCEASAQRCSWIQSDCKDFSIVTDSGTIPDITIEGEDYSIGVDDGAFWNVLKFPNSNGSTVDSLLGEAIFVRMLGGGGPYTTPQGTITALDADTDVFKQYSESDDLKTSAFVKYGEFAYWATFFRDRVVLRVEGRETTDAGNTSLRVSWDEDLRATAGGSTFLGGNAYRWKENGTAGTWSTENVDGAEPSGGDLVLPAAKQMIMNVGTTDGVWTQIATDLSNTNFSTVTFEENNDWDDMSLYVSPTLNQWVKATTVHVFYTSNSYQDADVDEYIADWASPSVLTNFDSGSLKTDAAGDDDADGFNERYGWYEVTANAGGAVQFDMPDVDIVRKTPVFKINNAILNTYIITINGVVMTEGDDYLITTEADETDVGTNVRIVQFLDDYINGMTNVSASGSVSCSIDNCGFCTTTEDCTNAGCYNQLDDTCAATEDPCHLSCGSCSSESDCGSSNQGCFYYNSTCNSEAMPVPETNAGCMGNFQMNGRSGFR